MVVTRFTAPAPGDVARADVERVLAAVEAQGRFRRDTDEHVHRTVFDTFDWRLFADGTVLEHEVTATERRSAARPDGGGWLVWRSLHGGEVLGRLLIEDVPRFAADLPAGPVTDRLASVLEMRALIPLVTLTSRRVELRLLDDEDKTVARVVVEDGVSAVADGSRPTHLPPRVEVQPVRGYDDEAAGLASLLASQVVLTPADDDVVVTALRAAGFVPGGYTGKLRLSLPPDATALEAWVTVFRALLDVMAINEPGVRDDLDSEFLHDYRVAVRRTRSVLGQAGGVIPSHLRDHLREEFRWLGGATSPTRDFDVYLLEIPEFRTALPVERRADLDPFAAFIAERQRAAHAALVADLDSPRYRDLMARWRAFLDAPEIDPDDAPDAARPATEVAAERTWKAYRKVIRDGRRIDDSSPPEDLHTLRKDAKKLRYALECYGSLFDSDEVGAVVKELKGLQDVLGEYQDCQVQIGSLEGFGQEMLDRGDVPASSIIALGVLVDHLDARERAARTAFDERFGRFDSKAVRRRMRRLFRHRSHHDHGGHHDHHGDHGDGG